MFLCDETPGGLDWRPEQVGNNTHTTTLSAMSILSYLATAATNSLVGNSICPRYSSTTSAAAAAAAPYAAAVSRQLTLVFLLVGRGTVHAETSLALGGGGMFRRIVDTRWLLASCRLAGGFVAEVSSGENNLRILIRLKGLDRAGSLRGRS